MLFALDQHMTLGVADFATGMIKGSHYLNLTEEIFQPSSMVIGDTAGPEDAIWVSGFTVRFEERNTSSRPSPVSANHNHGAYIKL